MKVVRENINEKFTEQSDPVKDMGIGFESKLKNLQNKSGYLNNSDFKDNDFIVYLFKKDYDKWKNKAGSVNIDNIEIWQDITSGNSPIIKIKAPGVRETTMMRGEAYCNVISKDIVNFLNSPEIKEKLVNQFNKQSKNAWELAKMIYSSANRKKLSMPGIYMADEIGKRLIKILK